MGDTATILSSLLRLRWRVLVSPESIITFEPFWRYCYHYVSPASRAGEAVYSAYMFPVTPKISFFHFHPLVADVAYEPMRDRAHRSTPAFKSLSRASAIAGRLMPMFEDVDDAGR